MSSDAQFYEVMPVGAAEEDRARNGWIVIMDRATAKAILAHADSRERALWLLRALNVAEQAVDRMPEP